SGDEFFNSRGECLRISRWHKQSTDTVLHEFGDAGDVRCNDWKAAGHSLHKYNGNAFGEASHNKDVVLGEQVTHLTLAFIPHEANAVPKAVAVEENTDVSAKFAVANDRECRVR